MEKEDVYERLIALKKNVEAVSLIDCQSMYFDILDSFVGQAYSVMKRNNLNPHIVAADMASREEYTKGYMSVHEKYVSIISEFWEAFVPTVRQHVERLQSLKSMYGGDIFPSYTHNIASSVGLYMDTILLPDPLLKGKLLTNVIKVEKLLYYTVKHSLSALNYRELALVEIDPPLVVIVPDFLELDQNAYQYIKESGEADVLYHCSKLFGRNFSSEAELTSFLKSFDNPQQIISSLAEPNRLLFDAEWEGSLENQYQRFIDTTRDEFGPQTPINASNVIPLHLTGRMMQINEVVFKASSYNSTSLIEAPTSWQYFLWKYQYDIERSKEVNHQGKNAMIAKVLQARDRDELKLISGLPQDVLIDLRRRGALAEFRETLRRGIDKIYATSPSALEEVSEAVAENIGEALTKHELELDALSDAKKRFFGWDVASWITRGGIAIAAASAGIVPLS